MHFLQSQAWQDFQESLGRKTFRRSGNGWQYLAILEHGTGNSRLYCPYGPEAKNQSALEGALASLVELAKKQSVTFVRIEPTDVKYGDYLKSNKWKKVDYQSLNPEHTNIVDLSPTTDELIAKMAQPVRNCYRNYQKKGLSVDITQDPTKIDIFLDLIHQVASRTGMQPHNDGYFQAQATSLLPKNHATLWYASFEKKPIAAALIYNGLSTDYYAHAAASSLPEHRKLSAPAVLVASAIAQAKRQAKSAFDLYGVMPQEAPRTHPWAGFTKFKRTFGGEDVSLAGSWDMPVNKLAYYTYRYYQKLRR